MITEKFKSLSLAALLITSATFVACSGDDNITEEQPVQPVQPQVYTMTVDASKGGDAADSRTTRALSLSGSTLSATWATTENVYVKKGDTWASGSLQPQADGATATLKGTLSGIEIAANDVLTLQFPKSGAISYAGQVGTLEDIAANFDYATATVKVASVSATGNINPEAATTTFQNQQAIVKFTLVDKDNSDAAISASELTVSDGTNTYTVTPASATSEIYVAIPDISEKTVKLTATVGSGIYTYEKTGVTFTNGHYYAITVKMTKVLGALSGKFTINSSGDKVYFSRGNLQYTRSTGKWSFMTNQYSTVETLNQNVGTDYASQDVVSLFGWGTSGWNNNNMCYQPYNTSNATSGDYASSKGYGYGPTDGSTYTYSLTDTYANADWGVYNTSDLGTDWRTLTKDEWLYLFGMESNNTDKSGHARYRKYFRATVNSVSGIVLLPDDISGISDIPVESRRGTASTFGGKTYTTETWSALESAGCVFLPAAGYRNGTSVRNVGSSGFYWSSTADGALYAYGGYFYSGGVYPADYSGRYYGYSVRLVREVTE